jgi:hypothetical protein
VAIHAVVLAGLCLAQPAIDKVAGAIPRLPLPVAMALTIVDVGCAIILHTPPGAALAQILSDAGTIASDVRAAPRRRGR